MGQKTVLHDTHVALGAKMVDFAGWEMPVQYSGTIAEHKAVRSTAGLFDVSHMGEFECQGPKAEAFLQQMTANDVTKLKDGAAQYSLLLNEDGGIIDDIIVYRHNAEHYLLIVNAGNLETDWHWLMAHQQDGAELRNRSNDFALFAVQGPQALSIVADVASPQAADLQRFTFTTCAIGQTDCIIAATGYTGEAGVEILVPQEHAVAVWTALMDAGTSRGMLPCGLAARDTLRLEMAYPLHGNDITDSTSPLEARLSWVVKLDTGKFIGQESLVQQKSAGLSKRLVGFKLTDPGIARHGYSIVDKGKPVGYVTSGSMSPSLGYSVGLAYVPAELSTPGTEFAVDIRGREKRAEVVALPFYQPTKA